MKGVGADNRGRGTTSTNVTNCFCNIAISGGGIGPYGGGGGGARLVENGGDGIRSTKDGGGEI
jgi:hypothetical protein